MTVLVVERGGVVHTFVAEPGSAAVESVAMGVTDGVAAVAGDRESSLWRRAVRMCSDGAELFGLSF